MMIPTPCDPGCREETAELTVEMGREFDSALPGQVFKSVHSLLPWCMGLGGNPMNSEAIRRADESEGE